MTPTHLTLGVAALLILTKALDCHSTAQGLRRASIALEANPLARGLMRRYGVTATIVGVFVVTVLVVAGAAAFAIANGHREAHATFVATGLLVSAVHVMVARHNRAIRPAGRRLRR